MSKELHMNENQENKNEDLAMDSANLYLVVATFVADEQDGKKFLLDVPSLIIIPKSIKDEEVEAVLKNGIPMDEGDTFTYRKIKVGETLQFIGYDEDGMLKDEDDGTKEGDLFTYKRCGLQFIQVFEQCKANDNAGFLFKTNELTVFPPIDSHLYPAKEEPKAS